MSQSEPSATTALEIFQSDTVTFANYYDKVWI